MVAVMPTTATASDPQQAPIKLAVRDLTISYGNTTALGNVSLEIREHEIFGIIGPANAGKTSFLKSLNRMDMFNSDMKVEGDILFNGLNIRHLKNVYALRSRIGVVFPLPVGLPLTIYENVALAPRLSGLKNKAELDVIVERCLTRAALWDPCPLAGTRGTDARRILDRGRPGDDHAHRGCAQRTQTRNDHHPGHQPGTAGPAPCQPHRVFPEW
jgi:phosphate transport system ATP-binding protein